MKRNRASLPAAILIAALAIMAALLVWTFALAGPDSSPPECSYPAAYPVEPCIVPTPPHPPPVIAPPVFLPFVAEESYP